MSEERLVRVAVKSAGAYGPTMFRVVGDTAWEPISDAALNAATVPQPSREAAEALRDKLKNNSLCDWSAEANECLDALCAMAAQAPAVVKQDLTTEANASETPNSSTTAPSPAEGGAKPVWDMSLPEYVAALEAKAKKYDAILNNYAGATRAEAEAKIRELLAKAPDGLKGEPAVELLMTYADTMSALNLRAETAEAKAKDLAEIARRKKNMIQHLDELVGNGVLHPDVRTFFTAHLDRIAELAGVEQKPPAKKERIWQRRDYKGPGEKWTEWADWPFTDPLPDGCAWAEFRFSDDGGATWHEQIAEPVPPPMPKPGPRKPVPVTSADPNSDCRYLVCVCGWAIPALPGLIICPKCGESLLGRHEMRI